MVGGGKVGAQVGKRVGLPVRGPSVGARVGRAVVGFDVEVMGFGVGLRERMGRGVGVLVVGVVRGTLGGTTAVAFSSGASPEWCYHSVILCLYTC
jgi:hypothetical protein